MKILMIVIVALLSFPVFAHTPFAQLSSDIDQVPLNPPNNRVKMEMVDGLHQVGITQFPKHTEVKIKRRGLYMIIAAPQTTTGMGCLNLWFQINGSDVDNSNVRVCQTHASDTDVIVSQGALCLKKHDVLTLGMSGIGIQSTKPPEEPLIPSIIFTMFHIGKCK